MSWVDFLQTYSLLLAAPVFGALAANRLLSVAHQGFITDLTIIGSRQLVWGLWKEIALA